MLVSENFRRFDWLSTDYLRFLLNCLGLLSILLGTTPVSCIQGYPESHPCHTSHCTWTSLATLELLPSMKKYFSAHLQQKEVTLYLFTFVIIWQHWESSFASELGATNNYGLACSSGNIKFSRIGFTNLKDTDTQKGFYGEGTKPILVLLIQFERYKVN